MSIRTLRKKTYLGEGYTHNFTNDSTGEAVFVPTTKKGYESLGAKGGGKNNPTLEGHTWQSSSGGTIKVDNPDGVLKEGEYVEIGEEIIARVENNDPLKQWRRASKAKMDSRSHEIDEVNLREY